MQLSEVNKRKLINSIKCGHEELNSNSPSSTNNVSLNNTTEGPVNNNDSILKSVLSFNKTQLLDYCKQRKIKYGHNPDKQTLIGLVRTSLLDISTMSFDSSIISNNNSINNTTEGPVNNNDSILKSVLSFNKTQLLDYCEKIIENIKKKYKGPLLATQTVPVQLVISFK